MSRVLVVAPHADDETLGMGATIAKLAELGDEVVIAVVTGMGPPPHPLWSAEVFARVRTEAVRAADLLGAARLVFRDLPAAMLDTVSAAETNAVVSDLVREFAPNELFLPYLHDLHGDHRAVTYAGLVGTRPYLVSEPRKVYMYETPTETHLFPGAVQPGFVPNVWVDVSATIDKKLAAWGCYESQHHGSITPRSDSAIRALATWRGAQIGVASAEAFLLTQELR